MNVEGIFGQLKSQVGKVLVARGGWGHYIRGVKKVARGCKFEAPAMGTPLPPPLCPPVIEIMALSNLDFNTQHFCVSG